jgi:hypothetical protein
MHCTYTGNVTTEIDSLVNASMADSTWKTYKTAVESFQSFRKLYKLQDTWPAPLYDLLFYIAYMSHTGLSASKKTQTERACEHSGFIY